MFFQACQIHPRTSVRPSEPRFRGRDTAYDIRRVEHGLQVFERKRASERSVTISFRQLHVAVIFQVLYQPLAAIGHLVE
jgi:hypothetical protein